MAARNTGSHSLGRIIALTSLLLVLAALGFAASAFAGSGDFVGCTDVYLTSGANCNGPNVHTWVETEGWNTDGNGRGVCTGYGVYGSFELGVCDGDNVFNVYNAIYCTTSCNGATAYGWVGSNSSTADYFTGWGDYSS
jgi:hypothetical protein